LVVLKINVSVLLKNIFNGQRLFITGEQKLIEAEKYIHETNLNYRVSLNYLLIKTFIV
jgi:hypothetical protein